MALFGGKKKTKTDSTATQQSVEGGTVAQHQVDHSVADVLIGPRITEKAALGSEHNVYTFNVTPNATKSDITRAIRKLYSVTPRKVNVAQIPYKQVQRRGITGRKRGGKRPTSTSSRVTRLS